MNNHAENAAYNGIPSDHPAWAAWPPRYMYSTDAYSGQHLSIYNMHDDALTGYAKPQEAIERGKREIRGYFESCEAAREQYWNLMREVDREYNDATRDYSDRYDVWRTAIDKEYNDNGEELRSRYYVWEAAAIEVYGMSYREITRKAAEYFNDIADKLRRERDAKLRALQDMFEELCKPHVKAKEAKEKQAKKQAKRKAMESICAVLVPWRTILDATTRGACRPVFWDERFFRDVDWQTRLECPWVNVDQSDQGSLRFIANERDAQRLRFTTMKAGRYLKRYFGDTLAEREIQYFTQWQQTGIKQNRYTDETFTVLGFARTPDEIEHVYTYGPSSCMAHGVDQYGGIHPARVYGAGDLAVAWLADKSDVDESTGQPRCYLARALVWPDKHVIGRVYPGKDSNRDSDLHEALDQRLRAQGYRNSIYRNSDAFNGARLLVTPWPANRAPRDNYYSMPYLDVVSNVSWHPSGKFFVIDSNGDIDAQNTGGYCNALNHTAEEDSWTCDNCDSGQDEDSAQRTVYTRVRRDRPSGEQTWCDCCFENSAIFCQGFNEYFDDNNISLTEADDGEYYTVAWLEANAFQSDKSGDWIVTSDSVAVLIADGEPQKWSQNEAHESATVCAASSQLVDSEQTFECAVTGDSVAIWCAHALSNDCGSHCSDDDVREYLAANDARQATLELAAD